MSKSVMKKKSITLEDVVIHNDEQPYVIPDNWSWTTLTHLVEQQSGNSKLIKGKLSSDYDESLYKAYSASGQDVFYSEYENEGEAIIVSAVGARCGKAFMANGKWSAIANTHVIRPKNPIMINYLYFMINNEDWWVRSGSAQPFVAVNDSLNRPFALPPIVEQKRIIEKIESLFRKLDASKEKLLNELEKFDDRKMAILHDAFLGNLTGKWRNQNNVELDSWVEKEASELFEYVTSGSRGWAKYYADEGAIFVRMGNLDHGTIDLDLEDIQYVNLPDKVEGQRTLLKKDDILISITADVGMIGLVRELSGEAYINQHVALARPKGIDNAEFLAWYLVSDVGFVQLRNKQRGATKVGLGLDDIRSLTLKMPSNKEQEEIVSIVNKLLKNEDDIKGKILNVIGEIDLMKKSILSKAFRGELGTNNPEEESSIELIKSLLETV